MAIQQSVVFPPQTGTAPGNPSRRNPALSRNTACKSKPPSPTKSTRKKETQVRCHPPFRFSERYPRFPPALRNETAEENPPCTTSVSSVKHEALKLPSKDGLRGYISAQVAPSLTPVDIPLRVRALCAAVPDTHDDSDYSTVGVYIDNHNFMTRLTPR